MLLKSSTSRPQFVGGIGDDAHVEAAGGDLTRGAREPGDGIGHAAGDRCAEARRKQNHDDPGDQHAAIELSRSARSISRCRSASGTLRTASRRGRHRRGGDEILERADPILRNDRLAAG